MSDLSNFLMETTVNFKMLLYLKLKVDTSLTAYRLETIMQRPEERQVIGRADGERLSATTLPLTG